MKLPPTQVAFTALHKLEFKIVNKLSSIVLSVEYSFRILSLRRLACGKREIKFRLHSVFVPLYATAVTQRGVTNFVRHFKLLTGLWIIMFHELYVIWSKLAQLTLVLFLWEMLDTFFLKYAR